MIKVIAAIMAFTMLTSYVVVEVINPPYTYEDAAESD